MFQILRSLQANVLGRNHNMTRWCFLTPCGRPSCPAELLIVTMSSRNWTRRICVSRPCQNRRLCRSRWPEGRMAKFAVDWRCHCVSVIWPGTETRSSFLASWGCDIARSLVFVCRAVLKIYPCYGVDVLLTLLHDVDVLRNGNPSWVWHEFPQLPQASQEAHSNHHQ